MILTQVFCKEKWVYMFCVTYRNRIILSFESHDNTNVLLYEMNMLIPSCCIIIGNIHVARKLVVHQNYVSK